jgi:hypothetical protein
VWRIIRVLDDCGMEGGKLQQLYSKLLGDPDQMESGGHGARVRLRGDGYSGQDRCVMQGLARILGLEEGTE